MTYKKINASYFNSMKFIKGIEKRYGYELASKVANDFTRLATIAQTNDYLDELNSPRFVARFKLHPITGGLIVETINDKRKGYRYTFTPSKVNRKKVNYD